MPTTAQQDQKNVITTASQDKKNAFRDTVLPILKSTTAWQVYSVANYLWWMIANWYKPQVPNSPLKPGNNPAYNAPKKQLSASNDVDSLQNQTQQSSPTQQSSSNQWLSSQWLLDPMLWYQEQQIKNLQQQNTQDMNDYYAKRDTVNGVLSELKQQYDTEVSSNLKRSNKLLAWSLQFQKMASWMWLSSQDILSLSKTRDSYIADYKNDYFNKFKERLWIAWEEERAVKEAQLKWDNSYKILRDVQKDYDDKVEKAQDLYKYMNKADLINSVKDEDWNIKSLVFKKQDWTIYTQDAGWITPWIVKNVSLVEQFMTNYYWMTESWKAQCWAFLNNDWEEYWKKIWIEWLRPYMDSIEDKKKVITSIPSNIWSFEYSIWKDVILDLKNEYWHVARVKSFTPSEDGLSWTLEVVQSNIHWDENATIDKYIVEKSANWFVLKTINGWKVWNELWSVAWFFHPAEWNWIQLVMEVRKKAMTDSIKDKLELLDAVGWDSKVLESLIKKAQMNSPVLWIPANELLKSEIKAYQKWFEESKALKELKAKADLGLVNAKIEDLTSDNALAEQKLELQQKIANTKDVNEKAKLELEQKQLDAKVVQNKDKALDKADYIQKVFKTKAWLWNDYVIPDEIKLNISKQIPDIKDKTPTQIDIEVWSVVQKAKKQAIYDYFTSIIWDWGGRIDYNKLIKTPTAKMIEEKWGVDNFYKEINKDWKYSIEKYVWKDIQAKFLDELKTNYNNKYWYDIPKNYKKSVLWEEPDKNSIEFK